MKIIFVDRDGVINKNRDDYVKCWSEFEFITGSLEALKLLTDSGHRIIVITNQSALNRKLVAEATIEEIHTKMAAAVSAHGSKIEAIYYCPHLPEDACGCRKPKPGLIYRARDDFQLDLSETCMIGDSFKDIRCARQAGCGAAILVRTGHGVQAERLCRKEGIAPDHFADDLLAAAQWFLGPRSKVNAQT